MTADINISGQVEYAWNCGQLVDKEYNTIPVKALGSPC